MSGDEQRIVSASETSYTVYFACFEMSGFIVVRSLASFSYIQTNKNKQQSVP